MSRISVTVNGSSTSPIVWTSMTPWVSSAMQQHVTVPGGDGLGVTFRKGRDNAVTTLQGRVLWTSAGQSMLKAISGAMLTVSNGIDTHTGIAGSPTISGDSTAWIRFSISVTEV